MAAVSIEDKGGGKWRLRWREKRVDGSLWSREVTVTGSKEDAETRRLAIINDVRTTGHHDPDAHRAKYAPPANLIDGMLAAIHSWVGDGLSASSAGTYRDAVRFCAEAIHEVTGIPTTQPLPVALLSRPLFDALKPVLARRGETAPRAYLRVMWSCWGWIAHDPVAWPHTPPRPPSPRGYLPPPKVYGRTTAPRPEDADACLRHLAARSRGGTLLCAIVMRYTGLRLRQVTGILREDVNLEAGTLLVRNGKTKQERADMRVVPLSLHLLAEPRFRAAVEAAGAGVRVVPATSPASVIRDSWQDATTHDGVPKALWAPPNRTNARPDHAFRASLQAHMTEQRVAQDVIDFLVGHAGGLRAVHYGRDLLKDARAAVDGLPPIDWGDAVAETGKVVRLRP